MTQFATRLDSAVQFERAVTEALISRGWVAELFGQGQLSERIRRVLREVVTPVRWMPDIIAVKRFTVRTAVVFIDAKAGERWRQTAMHGIEIAALDAASRWARWAGPECRYYFVFTSWGAVEPSIARDLAIAGQYRGNGSGTPFVLIPTYACTPFDAAFGAVP